MYIELYVFFLYYFQPDFAPVTIVASILRKRVYKMSMCSVRLPMRIILTKTYLSKILEQLGYFMLYHKLVQHRSHSPSIPAGRIQLLPSLWLLWSFAKKRCIRICWNRNLSKLVILSIYITLTFLLKNSLVVQSMTIYGTKIYDLMPRLPKFVRITKKKEIFASHLINFCCFGNS